jgi:fermentation-respiration switch protein FrsA (DUF1100 family)
VLEAAFTSSHDMLSRYFPWGIPASLLQSSYENMAKIGSIQTPILFIHAELDEAIPMEMAERLYARVEAPKWFYRVPGANHNDTFVVDGPNYFQQWRLFVDECVRRRDNGPGG